MSGKNFKKPKKQCNACNCLISNNNYSKHIKICNGKPSLYVRHANGAPVKRLKRISELNWTEIQAYYNDNRSYKDVCEKYELSTSTVAIAVKKGLFKTRSSGETARLKGSYNNKIVSEETRAKLSRSMRKAVLEGRQRTPRPYGERCNHYDHISWLGNKEHLHGGWEKIVAEFLDEERIKWYKSKKSFTYSWQNKQHEYFPDFYLEEYMTYIEVKGCKVERDEAKWSSFPEKLLVIDKDSIYNLKQFFNDNLYG
jgi:uncharacterized protein (DUF1330 family)